MKIAAGPELLRVKHAALIHSDRKLEMYDIFIAYAE